MKKIINQVLINNGLPSVLSLTDDIDLRIDLGLDSLGLAELTIELEEKFGVDVFEDGLVSTVGEIRKKIEVGDG